MATNTITKIKKNKVSIETPFFKKTQGVFIAEVAPFPA